MSKENPDNNPNLGGEALTNCPYCNLASGVIKEFLPKLMAAVGPGNEKHARSELLYQAIVVALEGEQGTDHYGDIQALLNSVATLVNFYMAINPEFKKAFFALVKKQAEDARNYRRTEQQATQSQGVDSLAEWSPEDPKGFN